MLLHGLGVDHRMWAFQVNALQDLSRLHAPDLPGFGTEPALPEKRRTLEECADWVAQWLRERGVDRCAVAGYSLGGTLALVLALRHPGLITRLVLACCSARWALGWRDPIARVVFGPGGRVAVWAFRQSILWAFRRWGQDPSQRPAVEDMVRRAQGPTMLDLCRHLARADYLPSLAAVRAPTLVVGGSRDHLAPPSHLRLLAGGIPGALLEILPRATHVLCLTHHEQFSDILARFFSSSVEPNSTGKDQFHASS